MSVRRGSAVPDDASQIPDNASDSGKCEFNTNLLFSLQAKKVNLAMLIPAWFYVRNAI